MTTPLHKFLECTLLVDKVWWKVKRKPHCSLISASRKPHSWWQCSHVWITWWLCCGQMFTVLRHKTGPATSKTTNKKTKKSLAYNCSNFFFFWIWLIGTEEMGYPYGSY
jgi:hypothetical protein